VNAPIAKYDEDEKEDPDYNNDMEEAQSFGSLIQPEITMANEREKAGQKLLLSNKVMGNFYEGMVQNSFNADGMLTQATNYRMNFSGLDNFSDDRAYPFIQNKKHTSKDLKGNVETYLPEWEGRYKKCRKCWD
jgi:hypothetical protein